MVPIRPCNVCCAFVTRVTRDMVTCLEMMQRALAIVERWCDEEGLVVNPSKTVMIPFTRRRKLKSHSQSYVGARYS
ncbi:hypothetical protein J6590_003910 [Homalodisca vitripennis]|nr:hypothetical protein J6590_003910 [Homalodisca vitripennis]